jgi:acetyl esterase/lipase
MSVTWANSLLQVERVAPEIGWRGWISGLSRTKSRMWNRIVRALGQGLVLRTARALEGGDIDALRAAIAHGRALHMRFDRPARAQMTSAMHGVALNKAAQAETRTTWATGPALTSHNTLLYVPGGSFVAQRSASVTAMIARVAKAAQMQTLICDYRLAPEHPCPAAVDDVVDAFHTLLGQGIAADRVCLVAESAGAAIALSAVRRLMDGGNRPRAIVLFSPWTNLALRNVQSAARGFSSDAPFGMDAMAVCAHLYLQGRPATDPLASPFHGELRGLPPMLIHTSKTDPLHDDACALADKAAKCGVPVTLRIWPSGNHVFERFYGEAAERSIHDAGAFLRARMDERTAL